MRLEHLHYFLEVTQTQSISVAAENLYLTQPALSRAIKSLEQELGVTLFFRTADGVRLTSAGEAVLPMTRTIIDNIHDLIKKTEEISHKDIIPATKQKLTLLTFATIADSLLLLAVGELAQAFPSVAINIDVLGENDYFTLPDPAIYDLFIGSNINHLLDEALANSHLQVDTLFMENFSVVVSNHHPLAGKKIVSHSDVFDYKLVVHNNGFSAESFYQHFLPPGKKVEIILKSNNVRAITQILEKHQAILFTNNILIRSDFAQLPSLKIIPLKNSKGHCFALYEPNHPNLSLITQIIDILKFNRANH